MPRKPSLDGKDSSLRIRMSPEQKEKLVSYAERHYQTMSNVIFQACLVDPFSAGSPKGFIGVLGVF